jgi:hypothetical protein
MSRRFGWVNASYVYGLQIVDAHQRRALGTLTPWDKYAKAIGTINEGSFSKLDPADSGDSSDEALI